MPTGITCPQVYCKTPTEVRGVAVDMRGVLTQDEVLTGTPTITVSGPSTSAAVVTTTVQTINKASVDVGQAITFTISGGSDATDYSIKVSCSTSASQTVEVYCRLSVRVPTFTNP